MTSPHRPKVSKGVALQRDGAGKFDGYGPDVGGQVQLAQLAHEFGVEILDRPGPRIRDTMWPVVVRISSRCYTGSRSMEELRPCPSGMMEVVSPLKVR